MGRTTIARDLIDLIKMGKAAKDDVLRALAAASSGAEQLRRGDPAVVVTIHELRNVKPGDTDALPALARGTHAMPEQRIDAVYDVLAEVPLYELTDTARVDVLRVGRHPDQDVQLLDRTVSREHGLVIFADKLPLFCDYGTLKGGVHAGSMNGTFLAGDQVIKDTMITWLPAQELFISKLRQRTHDGDPCYRYRLSYTFHRLN